MRVRAALADGYAVVIGLQSTGEAALERAAAADGDLRSLVSLCRGILIGFLEAHFPVTRAADAKLEKEYAKAEEAVLTARAQLASCRAAATRPGATAEAHAALHQAQRALPAAEATAAAMRASIEADQRIFEHRIAPAPLLLSPRVLWTLRVRAAT